ncbi:MAG: glycosyltransferase family 1 protein [Candidatus Margulisiibacteriota bacterium]
MRIGIDCRTLSRDSYGIGTYVKNIIPNLLKTDKSNDYFLFFDLPDIPQFDWLDSRCKCVYVPFWGVSKKAGGNFAAPFWENLALPRSLKKMDIDVYLGANFMVPRLTNVPAVSVVHGMAPFVLKGKEEPWLFKAYFKTMLRFSVAKARKVIAVSSDVKVDLVKYLKVPSSKIEVVHLAPAPFFRRIDNRDLLVNVKKKYGLPDKFILFVGGLTARKNLTTLVKAFSLAKKQGLPHKLVLCGGRRFGTDEIADEIDRLGMREEIVFTGMVPYDERLAAVYSLAEAVVLPSLHESIGLPLMEAMACGIPVVASNIPAIVENIGGAGILVDPLDVDGWAAAVVEVLSKTDLRQELRQKGFERLRQYSWEDTAQKTLRVLEDACAGC